MNTKSCFKINFFIIYCQLMFDCMLTYIPIYLGLHKIFLDEMKTKWKSLKKPILKKFLGN